MLSQFNVQWITALFIHKNPHENISSQKVGVADITPIFMPVLCIAVLRFCIF